MKTLSKSILFFFLSAFFLVSCSSEDDSSLTGVKGKPSSFKFDDNRTTLFSYTGNKISQIRNVNNFIDKFNYENGELVSIYTSPDDKDIADGHGSVKFKKNGNVITIDAWGEPSSNIIRWELELDKNNLPQRILEIGVLEPTPPNGDLVMIEAGKNYGVFTYDVDSKKLKELSAYTKNNTPSGATYTLDATYTYEYDDKVGIFSKVDLPIWYYAYKIYGSRQFSDAGVSVYFNYYNNLVKKTDGNQTFNFKYQYDNESTPVSMTIESAIWGNSFTIAY